jgi:hypothetical protein
VQPGLIDLCAHLLELYWCHLLGRMPLPTASSEMRPPYAPYETRWMHCIAAENGDGTGYREWQSFRAPSCLLPDYMADMSCSDLGRECLHAWMNSTMGTSYPFSERVNGLLQRCIDKEYDFGTACAFLRPLWSQLNSQARPQRTKFIDGVFPPRELDYKGYLAKIDAKRLTDEKMQKDGVKHKSVRRNTPPSSCLGYL